MRIIAAGAEMTPGTNALYVMPHVPRLQRVADSMFEFGLTGNAAAPYQIAKMIQPEPGLIR